MNNKIIKEENILRAGKDLEITNQIINTDYTYKSTRENVIGFIYEVKGRYSSLINNFQAELERNYEQVTIYGVMKDFLYDMEKIRKDINLIKGKLETFIVNSGYDYTYNNKTNEIVVNNLNVNENKKSNKIDFEVNLKNIFSIIEENTSISQEEIEEIISKLNSIEEIVKDENLKRPKKWQKIKEIGKYILDKGIDISIVALPYILDVMKKIWFNIFRNTPHGVFLYLWEDIFKMF